MKALKIILSGILTVVIGVLATLGVLWHFTDVLKPKTETPGNNQTWVVYGGTWTGNPSTDFAVCTTPTPENWESRYILHEQPATDNYTVSANVKTAKNGSEGVHGEFLDYGLIPTYVDENNYVVFYYRYMLDTDGARMLGFLGINDRSNGVDSWHSVWSDQGDFSEILGANRAYNSKLNTALKIERSGDAYKVYFNDTLISTYISITGNAGAQNAKVGLYASGWADGCYFSNFKLGGLV